MQRFKIFVGNYNNTADEEANKWLEENPNVEIVEMRYQQARCGDHSICILYNKEK